MSKEHASPADFRITKRDLQRYRLHRGKFTERGMEMAYSAVQRTAAAGYPIDITKEGISFLSIEQLIDDLAMNPSLTVMNFSKNAMVRKIFEEFVEDIRRLEPPENP